MMKTTVLETIGLRREYRVGREAVIALGGVDIAVGQGEFVAIVGPSGCGKSTLLNLLGGLDQPSAGKVLLDGNNLADFSEEQLADLRRQKLGFIFQHHDLFPVLTARENIEFPLLLGGKAPQERTKRAEELLKRVGLWEKADYLPDELSGGQQQRVGIARALANNPLILLADEPTGNLDTRKGDEIVAIFQKLNRELGQTVIYVTHDPFIARHTRRIIYIQDGKLVKDEPVEHQLEAGTSRSGDAMGFDFAPITADEEEQNQ
jgi:putative ABC transport system ATP-binding protein